MRFVFVRPRFSIRSQWAVASSQPYSDATIYADSDLFWRGSDMTVIRGCQEGKVTPKLELVKCPKCGEELEVFVKMGGEIGTTGTLVADEECEECGYIAKAGTPVSEFERA